MRKLVLHAVILMIAGCFSIPVFGGEFDGGYGGAFYQVPIGARPTALGGAYRAVSDDGTAPLFNPAGMAGLKRPLLSSSYRLMQLDRVMGYAAAVFPTRGQSVLGVNWLYAGSGSVEARDVDGYLLGHDFSLNNHQFSVIFAKRFEHLISVGANISYLQSNGPELEAYSVGFDLGVMLYIEQLFDRDQRDLLPVRDIQVGLTVKHIAKEYRWSSEKYDRIYTTSGVGAEQHDRVPIEFGMGVSARFFERRLMVTSDLVKNEKQGPEFHAGTEFFLRPEFALRVGYGDSRFTAGTGYVFTIGEHQLAIDYAFSTDKADEGSEHIFSFDLWF